MVSFNSLNQINYDTFLKRFFPHTQKNPRLQQKKTVNDLEKQNELSSSNEEEEEKKCIIEI